MSSNTARKLNLLRTVGRSQSHDDGLTQRAPETTEDGDEEDGRFEEEDVAKDDTVIDPPRDGLTEVVEFRVSTS